jgi:hypothetical protein
MPIGELEGNLWLPEGIGTSTEVLYIWRLAHWRTNRIRIQVTLPVIHQACMTRYPRIHACYSDWQMYFTCRIDTHPWSVLKLWCSQKSTSYHWKYVHVVQTKFYTCYLLKPGQRWYGFFDSIIVNSSFSTIDIAKHRLSITSLFVTKGTIICILWSLIHKFAWFLLQGFMSFLKSVSNRELLKKRPYFCLPAFRR